MAPTNLRRRHILTATLALPFVAAAAPLFAQENAGGNPATPPDFDDRRVAEFDTPWAILPLAEGGFLITERGGKLWRVSDDGAKTEVAGAPKVEVDGQNGLHDVALAPDGSLRLTGVVPGDKPGGDLALYSAQLVGDRLENVTEIWRQTPSGGGGQPGAVMAFAPNGDLYLTVGDRMEPASLGPDVMRGVILRFAAGADTPTVFSRGHRNPYGLAFDAKGRLWSHEMGPAGGDELNLIVEGRDYGWPQVSYGDEYNGTPIADHTTRPDLAAPALYWSPVIAPAGMALYAGPMFADWAGDFLIGGLASEALIRVRVTDDAAASEVARYAMGARIRDVAVTPDGAVWVIEDASPGALRRLSR